MPYLAGVPEPKVQVGAPHFRHGLSWRGHPRVMKGQGVAAGPRTQQGQAQLYAPLFRWLWGDFD